MGALGYFILLLDQPDIAPLIDSADDVDVLISALAMVAAHVKP